MTMKSLFATVSALAVCAVVLLVPSSTFAGNDQANQAGLLDLGQACDSSFQCKSELRCEFPTDTETRIGTLGRLERTGGPKGECVAAFQGDGDNCYNYDCNRRFGMYCNEGSKPTFSDSYLGECKPKQPVGGVCGADENCRSGLKCDVGAKQCVSGSSSVASPSSWSNICATNYSDRVNQCISMEGETCVVDSECQFSELICNTAYTNAGGAFRSGRTGQCRLPSSVGGACEEAADCVSGLSCNTATNTCIGAPGSAAAGGAGTGTTGAGGAATGTNSSGQPLFGLQWFRNSDTGLRTDSPSAFLTGAARTVTGILALILVILIITGGIFMMTAAGNEKRYSFGKDVITYAIVGIIIVSAAYIIAELVIRAVTA